MILSSVSAATVNTVMGTLSAAFTWCIDRDWLEHNPCHGVKRLKSDARVFPWLDSPEAITRLLAQCPPHIRTIAAVLVGTGMRLDEALHLRWDDIDLEHRLITVHRGRRGRTKTGTTKSGKARRVPIFDSVLSVLRAMKPTRGPNTLLWPGGYRRLRDSEPDAWLLTSNAASPVGIIREAA
ncbi:MAG: tyrosine-type recombinase/integrase [Deltaproteobacteria bacterium]|nr:tyrosine-type recombinase/integrase [Deltaproteobacteria bacterium]